MGGNNKFTPPFTESQIKAFNIAPKITSSLSIFGSLFVIQHIILRDGRKKRLKTVYHRIILLGMSIMDFIFSIKQFVGKWAVPANEPVYNSASGTDATCTAFGFLGQGSALASIYYSGFLTLFFFLVVRLGWSEDKIRKFVEPSMHSIALIMGWGTAIAGLPLRLYNSGSTGCWINSHPPGCQESFNADNQKDGVDEPNNCTKGDNAAIYRIVFFWGQLWIIWILCVIAMILIYFGIYKAEKQVSRTSLEFRRATRTPPSPQQQQQQPSSSDETTGKNNNNNSSCSATRSSSRQQRRQQQQRKRKHSKRFAIQAMLYCTFFFLTWGFATIYNTVESFAKQVHSPLILLTVSFIPLQGFCNFLIYIRPRYLRHRRRRRQRNKRSNNPTQHNNTQERQQSSHLMIRWWSNIVVKSRFNNLISSSSKDQSSTSIPDNNDQQQQQQQKQQNSVSAVLSSPSGDNYNNATTTTTTTGVYDNTKPQPPNLKEESSAAVSNLNDNIITEDEDEDEGSDSVGSTSSDLEYLE